MYKRLTKLFIIIMNLGTILVATLEFTKGNFSRFLTFIAIFPVLLLPYVINKTKFKLDVQEMFLYYAFIFLADFLGCVVNLYNTLSWYDLFVHFLSGIFTFILGLMILKRVGNDDKKNKVINTIFALGVVSLIAVLWEIFEFGADNILKTNLQHNLDTGVKDTMGDMIVATLGGIVGMFFYLINVNKK